MIPSDPHHDPLKPVLGSTYGTTGPVCGGVDHWLISPVNLIVYAYKFRESNYVGL